MTQFAPLVILVALVIIIVLIETVLKIKSINGLKIAHDDTFSVNIYIGGEFYRAVSIIREAGRKVIVFEPNLSKDFICRTWANSIRLTKEECISFEGGIAISNCGKYRVNILSHGLNIDKKTMFFITERSHAN